MTDVSILFPFVLLLVAFLYASVGHGGASGYLALMVLFGTSIAHMKTSALVLNLFVSAIAFIQYQHAGHFRWRLLWPFILLSIPAAFLGSRVHVDPLIYRWVLALALCCAVFRLLVKNQSDGREAQPLQLPFALIAGALIGFISGMIGIGGGIILTPLLLILRWSDMKQAAAVSAAFIFLNSLAGLAGNTFPISSLPSVTWMWIAVACIGGAAGAWLGSKRFHPTALRYILSIVLLIASIKLILTA